MNLSHLARRVLVAACLLIIPTHAFAQYKYLTYWSVEENQLITEEGGRANTVAVNPGDRNQMFVASDTGGLFKTVDGGRRWTHVDQLPVIFTQSVVYVNTETLLVSAKADYKTINGGGVWRTTNGGQDWTQVLGEVPNSSERLSAYEISMPPFSAGSTPIAVGTSDGVFVSEDGGQSWHYSNVFGNGFGVDKTVLSVLVESAPRNYRIYAGGPSGVLLGTYPFSSWSTPLGLVPQTIGDIHAFGRSPISSDHAYVVNKEAQLFATENLGRNWFRIQSAPAGGGSCDGSSFIRTVKVLDTLELYFGNRCGLHRLVAPFGPTLVNYFGTWEHATIDHGDTRDLGVLRDDLVLLASTGGVHVPSNHGLSWTLTGGGRAGGFNALQINEMKGQFVGANSPPLDLYIGTQDNHLFAATVNGSIHKKETFPRGHGLFIEAHPKLINPDTADITFQKCAPGCFRFNGNRRFAGDPDPWADPPNDRNAAPVLIRPCHYVQNVNDSNPIDAGLALTRNCGQTWSQFAAFDVEPRGRARLGRADNGAMPAVVYQPFRDPGIEPYASKLMRIRKTLTGDPEVTFPTTNFGGLGFLPTQGTHYEVFGIDPTRAFHLIAPDVVNQKVTEIDFGGTWREATELTNRVTDNGNRLFRTEILGPGYVAPIVTAVSFCPMEPSLILVGTNEGGIFYSKDNGDHWGKVSGSEKVTYVTSFVWENMNSVYVSTYGRGLWRLANKRHVVGVGIEDFCDRCDVVSDNGGSPSFDGAILAFDGRILDVRTEKGLVREVFVTPGTSVVFLGDENEPQDDIAITTGDAGDTPPPPKDRLSVGVVFTKDDTLVGTVFADAALTLVPPISDQEDKAPTDSPVNGRPYIRLSAGEVAVDEALDLTAISFASGGRYEVLVDGEAIQGGDVTADGAGSFAVKIAAPAAKGPHRVEVRAAGDARVIDGTQFLVR